MLTAQDTEQETDYERLTKKFVADVRSQLSGLTGEIALRNKTIQNNDAYVYGDLLSRSINIPVGHDFTPVNWLRRVCEIHRTQTMGDGFTVTSSYHGVDVASAADAQDKERLKLENDKKKDYAEKRGQIIDAIIRDNGGEAFWADLVENASCTGTSVIKAWYDDKTGTYRLEPVEAVENFYSLWSKNDFRDSDLDAFVYQISKQEAVAQFKVPITVATSPLGMPLAVLSTANTVDYLSTQPMVTIMEVSGKAQGWKSSNGILSQCDVGQETELNAVIVGDKVKKLIDDPRYIPKYYRFLNKKTRRRPWGLPDISTAAIQINQTYIETLSDWRTVASKVNFPKFKAFGFGLDVQLPRPKTRTVEMIALGEGQDIQPINAPNAQTSEEGDFQRQMAELKEEFVRETGISQQLFDNPDAISNSGQAMLAGMKTIGDQISARRQLWTPVINQVFLDAFECLSLWDKNIKEITEGDDDWYLRVIWPSALKKDDPAYQTMLLNRVNTNTISIQSFMERMGENGVEELDRIKDEMEDPFTAAIHGRMLQLLAQLKISGPPSAAPPKTTIALRGDLTPYQEGNIASQHGFNDGPFPASAGPQGTQGRLANENEIDKGFLTAPPFQGGTPIQHGPGGQPIPSNQPPQTGPPPGPQVPVPQQQSQPGLVTPTPANQTGQALMSTPGSGQAQPTTGQGNLNKSKQKRGR